MFKNIIDNITNKITDKVNTLKEENIQYKKLLEETDILKNLYPIPQITKETQLNKINTIITTCPDINKEKAQLIANLIPIEETYLSINYAKEVKTNKEYYLITTTKYLWIINPTSYGIYQYINFKCQIIKNNLMSKIILINNILFEISGTDNNINTFMSLITNPTIRDYAIKEKTNYLCGIIPTYQKINSIYSGISLDNESNIVFHTKENNYKYKISDILYYEILLDNSIIFSNKNNTSNKITNFQNNCYQISIRIITKDNAQILLPILEPNAFNTKYQRTDTVFQTNYNFAKEIIEKLKEITTSNY